MIRVRNADGDLVSTGNTLHIAAYCVCDPNKISKDTADRLLLYFQQRVYEMKSLIGARGRGSSSSHLRNLFEPVLVFTFEESV
jgi:hypothetical protein